jgi:S-adenosylmethionine decarboxylase
MNKITLGQQHLVELYDCCKDLINDKEFIRLTMIEAAKVAKATIVADVFHEYNPQGVSGVVVIAESHLAIHSWPEHRCVSIDLFTCSGQMNADLAIDYLFTAFKAGQCEVQKINRGQVPRLEMTAVPS